MHAAQGFSPDTCCRYMMLCIVRSPEILELTEGVEELTERFLLRTPNYITPNETGGLKLLTLAWVNDNFKN
jgi:hypothetical protein